MRQLKGVQSAPAAASAPRRPPLPAGASPAPSRQHRATPTQRRAVSAASYPQDAAQAPAAAATSSAAAPSPPQTPQDAAPAVEVKLVGVGTRGAASLQRLLAESNTVPNVVDSWCLDVDAKVLDSVSTLARGVTIAKDAGGGPDAPGPLSAEEITEIVGRTASDAGGRGNIGAGNGGVAFVLAPAAAGPGGAALLLQLVTALRAAGHFTVAAVTAPFQFEGSAKAEAAAAAVAALEGRAHLVAVMEQEVLLQAFGESQLTVAEATEIADAALEHTVRSVLQAVQAQEILKSSRGALMWHGRDLRHYKRLLAPPLQQLLTCPGTAVLGRGLAALPAPAGHAMGAPKALMHLASDAVIAAAESPFLDGALETASAVLCCVSLPPVGAQFLDNTGAATAFGTLLTPEGERHATRMAAQAAAGALRSITGRTCDDFVLCVEPISRDPMDKAEDSVDPSSIQVEATLLVLRSPVGAVSSACDGGQLQPQTLRGAIIGGGPAPAVGREEAAPKRAPGSKLAPSTWGMLSAMAGGAMAGKGGGAAAAAPSPPPAAEKAQQGGDRPGIVAPSLFGGGIGGRPVPVRKNAAPAPPPPPTSTPKQVTASTTTPAAPLTPPAAPAKPDNVDQERVTVGDYLAESLTAQSLDLPPAAARWRQNQRAQQLRQRRLVVWEADDGLPWEDEEKEEAPSGGLVAGLLRGRRRRVEERKVDIRSRVAGMLAQDREEGETSLDDAP